MRTDSRPFWDDALNVILSQVPPAGLDFPASGTRASATDIPNVALEWMVTPAYPNGAWFGSVGFHANQASLDAVPTLYLATDSTAMVAGVQVVWNGTGWNTVPGNILPSYDTWAEAVTAAGSTQGWIGRVKTLCGTDHFTAVHNGIRLRVLGGSAIIRDIGPNGAGYPLTATGTAYVALASYTIPAGMIGDGDQFGCAVFGANTGVLSSGNDSFSVRFGANQINAQSQVAFANRRSTSTGSLVRIGAQAICVSAGPNALSGSDNNNYPGGLISVDFSAAQTITVGATPGAVGNTMKIEQWSFGRIA